MKHRTRRNGQHESREWDRPGEGFARLAIHAKTVAELHVRPVAFDDKDVLRQLLELYLHDLSEFTRANVGSHGVYGYFYLDDYWTEPDRQPFLFQVDTYWAGLALVRSGSPHDMSEFFVMRKYRRSGVGRAAAQILFNLFPGEWQIRQLAANRPATRFWRSVIPVPFEEEIIEMGPRQRFRIGETRARA